MFALLLAAAGVTALYVFRQLYLVFAGEQRSHAYHPHESPRVMTWPLIALAALVTVGGILNAPPFNLLTRFLGGEEVPFEFGIAGAYVGLAALGWLGAWMLYGRQPLATGHPDPLQKVLGPVERFLHDFVHNALLVRAYNGMMQFLAGPVDRGLIDRGIERTAALSRDLSVRLRRL